MNMYRCGGKPEQEKSVTPSAKAQTVFPDSGKTLKKVTVNGDADLIPANIRQGVNIFGVEGELLEEQVTIDGVKVTEKTDFTTVLIPKVEIIETGLGGMHIGSSFVGGYDEDTIYYNYGGVYKFSLSSKESTLLYSTSFSFISLEPKTNVIYGIKSTGEIYANNVKIGKLSRTNDFICYMTPQAKYDRIFIMDGNHYIYYIDTKTNTIVDTGITSRGSYIGNKYYYPVDFTKDYCCFISYTWDPSSTCNLETIDLNTMTLKTALSNDYESGINSVFFISDDIVETITNSYISGGNNGYQRRSYYIATQTATTSNSLGDSLTYGTLLNQSGGYDMQYRVGLNVCGFSSYDGSMAPILSWWKTKKYFYAIKSDYRESSNSVRFLRLPLSNIIR